MKSDLGMSHDFTEIFPSCVPEVSHILQTQQDRDHMFYSNSDTWYMGTNKMIGGNFCLLVVNVNCTIRAEKFLCPIMY